MKTSESLFFVACLVGIIGVFLKMPKVLFGFSPQQQSPEVQFVSRCGTVMIVLFPALLIISSSYGEAFESGSSWGKPGGVRWMTFALTTSCLLVAYIGVLGLLYLVKRALSECLAGLKKMLSDVDLESCLGQFKPTPARGGGKKSKSFFYQAGEDLARGFAENTPGDEWKYPKDDDDEDEDPPPYRGPRNRWN